MITRKRIALASAALALGGGLIAAPGALASQGAPAAQAAAEAQAAQGVQKASCTYPNVCFIKGGKTVASYKDMGYQKLGTKARSATAGHNSRNDDGAKLYFVHTSGKKATSCAKPHQSWTVKKGWKMYALDIRNSPTCK
ncbi:hypothetical protein [Streptomyces scopuliridis]|uniref:Peptidase inhibitor family I36 n=1 Tax=Streptomyces scopuliridis RB72 TaxID=1440053 RepID=A0A2T7SUU3_9ACTN|nr:hypothetical protein [Streptomyces scopuliridis]PVE06604.1 hypothetical protein Y717_28345 [Streptomyces scopuliridis RB72]